MNRFGISKKTFWYSKELILFILLLFLLLSLTLFTFSDDRKRRLILFYPEDNLTNISGDFHIVPLKKTMSDNMKMTLSEALLHPFDYRLNPIVPENVKINSFILNQDNKELFIDLSIEMIRIDNSSQLGVDDALMLEILKKNLLFNHRSLQNVQFSIDGEVPFTPVFLPNKD